MFLVLTTLSAVAALLSSSAAGMIQCRRLKSIVLRTYFPELCLPVRVCLRKGPVAKRGFGFIHHHHLFLLLPSQQRPATTISLMPARCTTVLQSNFMAPSTTTSLMPPRKVRRWKQTSPRRPQHKQGVPLWARSGSSGYPLHRGLRPSGTRSGCMCRHSPSLIKFSMCISSREVLRAQTFQR